MKLLKGLFTGAAVLVILIIVISAFLPATFNVTRSIVIKADPSTVYYDVLDIRNWSSWDPWAKMDSAIENTYEGMPGVGHKNAWISEVIGNGSQTVIVAEPTSRIESDLFFEDRGSGGIGYFEFNKVDDGTQVVWGFKGENPFYMRIMGLLMDGFVGENFEEGLKGLKTRVEGLVDLPKVGVDTINSMYYISMRITCDVESIGANLASMYGEISSFMAENGMEAIDMPMALYHTFDFETTDMEAAIPVEEGTYSLPEGMNYGKLEEGMAVMALHIGPYESVAPTHNAIDDYMKANNLSLGGAIIEMYTNDPATVEKDQIETKIIYPIASN